MEQYNPADIEKKWQAYWREHNVYTISNESELPPYYVLDMFPYPSGAGLHVGHPRGYVGSDVFARAKRMQGYNVLHPMGFDSFGLPAEQYAIQTGNHPGPHTDELIVRYREQLEMIGFSYDWSREVSTHRPDYYRWTQWIFTRLYEHYFDTDKNRAMPVEHLIQSFKSNGTAGIHAACNNGAPDFTAQEWNTFSAIEQQNILMKYRLAYQGYAEVNWCPELGTVLANDEIVMDSDGRMVSERGSFPVEKKSMRQWFMRITAYADRLLAGLDGLDWRDSIKEIQRNWIGRSQGAEIQFELRTENREPSGIQDHTITVFTTRADTLFGATYLVLAPEHALVSALRSQISNITAVDEYISWVASRGEDDRIAAREKTGVQLQGITAINPANGESIPVWIADYVLAGYGTGAVMAVPAHDERDFEFAKKYNLPIKKVIEPVLIQTTGSAAFRRDEPVQDSNGIIAIIKHWSKDSYIGLRWPKSGWGTLLTGGIDEGYTPEETVLKEIYEETGFKNAVIVRSLGVIHSKYYHDPKQVNRFGHAPTFYVELSDGEQDNIDAAELSKHELLWLTKSELRSFLTATSHQQALELLDHPVYTGDGLLTQSGTFNNVNSTEAKSKIIEFVGGQLVTKYKMRDAIFARQRYWGEPIPLRHDTDGIISVVPDRDLPLVLPDVESYQPSGEGQSPLARTQSWVDAGYETNTMPGWAGSSWYWLRYMDPQNTDALAAPSAIAYWKHVDMYIGGTEHATGHLLYSRFWNMFLYDIGVAHDPEPFHAMRNQGLILASDGRKMSKRWGNTVTPDEMVERFGADAFRLYECFIGPFDASQPWIVDGVVGCRRFLEKVWRVGDSVRSQQSEVQSGDNIQKILHKTIKKVTENIAEFKFNTAVPAMMELVNEMDKTDVAKADFIVLLKLLAPFAPHMTEELFQELEKELSIHLLPWPDYDPDLIHDDTVSIALQVNGKTRDVVTVSADITDEDLLVQVTQTAGYQKWVGEQIPKKTIIIPGKIVSFIV